MHDQSYSRWELVKLALTGLGISLVVSGAFLGLLMGMA
jgi:hypothetical protein